MAFPPFSHRHTDFKATARRSRKKPIQRISTEAERRRIWNTPLLWDQSVIPQVTQHIVLLRESQHTLSHTHTPLAAAGSQGCRWPPCRALSRSCVSLEGFPEQLQKQERIELNTSYIHSHYIDFLQVTGMNFLYFCSVLFLFFNHIIQIIT